MTDPTATESLAGGTASIYTPYTVAAATHYSYFRLGNPDPTTEGSLPNDSSAPATLGDGSVTYDPGAVLYTNDAITVAAPSMKVTSPSIVINTTVPPAAPVDPFVNAGITHFTPKTLTAVVSSPGSEILSASMQTNGSGGLFGSRAASVTFQNTDQLQVTNGDSSNFLNGNALTFWNGNDQSIGIGGLLWANAGITSNLFGGMIVNVTNESVGLQGLGENDVKIDHTLTGTSAITMQVAPLSATLSLARAKQITYAMNIIMAASTAAASIWSGTVLKKIHDDTQLVDSADSIANLQSAMTTTNRDLDSLTELIFAVQALSVLLGLTLCLTKGKSADAVAALKLTATGIGTLSGGESDITLGPTGVDVYSPGFLNLNAIDTALLRAATEVCLSSGPIGAGPQVVLGVDSVTLSAGPGASIVLGPAGITMNGVQISTNALQQAFSPGVQPVLPSAAPVVVGGVGTALRQAADL